MENKKCQTCGTAKEQTFACSACKSTHYCSRECQKLDWKDHKLTCGKINVIKQDVVIMVYKGDLTSGNLEDNMMNKKRLNCVTLIIEQNEKFTRINPHARVCWTSESEISLSAKKDLPITIIVTWRGFASIVCIRHYNGIPKDSTSTCALGQGNTQTYVKIYRSKDDKYYIDGVDILEL